MKFEFLIFESKAPEWVQSARQEYAAKLQPFFSFTIRSLKSPSADRESSAVKRKKEAELLFKQLDEKDLLILFDEGGKSFRSSEEFSTHLTRPLESGKSRVVFCIGGPYGFESSVKERSGILWSLSPLTMNHWVAQIAALEQLYRAMTLVKGIPYHNR